MRPSVASVSVLGLIMALYVASRPQPAGPGYGPFDANDLSKIDLKECVGGVALGAGTNVMADSLTVAVVEGSDASRFGKEQSSGVRANDDVQESNYEKAYIGGSYDKDTYKVDGDDDNDSDNEGEYEEVDGDDEIGVPIIIKTKDNGSFAKQKAAFPLLVDTPSKRVYPDVSNWLSGDFGENVLENRRHGFASEIKEIERRAKLYGKSWPSLSNTCEPTFIRFFIPALVALFTSRSDAEYLQVMLTEVLKTDDVYTRNNLLTFIIIMALEFNIKIHIRGALTSFRNGTPNPARCAKELGSNWATVQIEKQNIPFSNVSTNCYRELGFLNAFVIRRCRDTKLLSVSLRVRKHSIQQLVTGGEKAFLDSNITNQLLTIYWD
ncbi:LOW QUALITY PROTEIN: hypothetical protein BJ085DRAFT_32356 [Dimargaris cristalligena]|uniref:Uncharacterized protein n=1 Tax=Dimargaris cristalligena TaxID=215637 RepID=A0A4V1J4U9_9FUNG|nr:LOW QUALITY PROTEIN: hypothetical protein BJ085DRAFT_32356 [Dimargaris cristalligena]|eukprot:RKP36819.1 LOW QUALITY PROTEIN: hypothetical protein BJ085DRAFT_32356 [Dimargaris cristalligena]